MKKFNVAVVGATGNVGREILNIIDNRKFPLKNLVALASEKSNGHSLSYGSDKEIKVQCLEGFNFKEIDLVLSSAGSEISEKFAEGAVKSGAIVIDNTSFFRMKKDIPLIVPEVNPDDLSKFRKKKLSPIPIVPQFKWYWH